MIIEFQEPAPTPWVAMRIGVLLAHYYAPDAPEKMQQAVAKDWVGVLSHFPKWALGASCDAYMASDQGKRKPTPSDIATGARHAMRHLEPLRRDVKFAEERIEQMAMEPPTEDAKARVQAMTDAFRRGN